MSLDPLLLLNYDNLRPRQKIALKERYKIQTLTKNVYNALKRQQNNQVTNNKERAVAKELNKLFPRDIAEKIQNLSISEAERWFMKLPVYQQKSVSKLLSLNKVRVTRDANTFTYNFPHTGPGSSLYDLYNTTEWGNYNNLSSIDKLMTIYGLYFDPGTLRHLEGQNRPTGIELNQFKALVKNAQKYNLINNQYLPTNYGKRFSY